MLALVGLRNSRRRLAFVYTPPRRRLHYWHTPPQPCASPPSRRTTTTAATHPPTHPQADTLKDKFTKLKWVPFNPVDKFTQVTCKDNASGRVFRLMKGSPQVRRRGAAGRGPPPRVCS